MTSPATIPVVVITGAIGVGKTTVTQRLGDLLAAQEIPHTVIDMDRLRDTWPHPAGDRFNVRLGFRNLADVARNSRAAGSRHIAIADVVETRGQGDRYREAIPGAVVTIVRLIADPDVIRARIDLRAQGNDQPWELHRTAELDEIMDEAAVADMTIDTTDRSPQDVAGEIGARLGWLRL